MWLKKRKIVHDLKDKNSVNNNLKDEKSVKVTSKMKIVQI